MTISSRSLYRNWRPVTVEEMKGFIAVVLNMGIVQLTNLKDYWSTDDITNFPFFRSVFSRDRFFQIFGMLYVGDPDGTTKRSKIQPLLDRLCPVFEATFTPDRQIAVDESVINFKGRVSFRQYLKGKPHPWGIKAFVLSDSKTGYLQRVCVYYGRETQLIDNDNPHTVRVVQTLVEPFHNKGYDLYVDRFYTSPLLASELMKVGITVTGTVQSNRRGMPKEVTDKRKKEPRGNIRAARSGNILALSWLDKRKVLMLSTKHNASTTQVRTRYTIINSINDHRLAKHYNTKYHVYLPLFCPGVEKSDKPTVVADYNQFMLGVDKLDPLMAYHSFLHKSVKWWRKIFFWLLEVMVINSYIIYKELARRRGERPITHLAFRRRLIESLSESIRSRQ